MVNKFIKNVKIKNKIIIFFSIIIILFSIAILKSINTISQSESGINSFYTFSRHNETTSNIEAQINALRLNIKEYQVRKDSKDIDNFNFIIKSLTENIKRELKEIGSTDIRSRLKQIETGILELDNRFKKVVELIKNNNKFKKQNIDEINIHIIDLANSLFKKSESNNEKIKIEQIKSHLYKIQLEISNLLISNSSSNYTNILELSNNIIIQIKHLKQPDSIITKMIGLSKNNTDNLNTLFTTKVKIDKEIKSIDEISREIINNAKKLSGIINTKTNTLGSSLSKEIESSLNISLTISIISILLSIFLAYNLIQIITKPIVKIINYTSELAKGNLSFTVSVDSHDEMGLLSESIQQTVSNLRNMISSIVSSSQTLATASEELSATTDQSAQSIQGQEMECEQVATSMNEMSLTIQDISQNASNASDAAQSADSQVNEGTIVVAKTNSSIIELIESINNASEQLGIVDSNVTNIGSVLNVIVNIAEQINLLALNAAIEAARAGDQGRGFAVVADEVRSLAVRTQKSTTEIKDIILSLQHKTAEAVEAMSNSVRYSQECIVQSEQATNALETIRTSVALITDMNMQIASASEEQSSVSSGINNNLINIRNLAQENTTGSEQARIASLEIAKSAENLFGLVSQFKL